MSKATLLAVAVTVTLATGWVAAQTPPPQAPPAPRPAAPGQPPMPPVPGQPAPAGMRQGPMNPQGQNELAPWAGLALNDDQRQKVRDTQRSTRDQAAPLEDELLFTRRALHREIYADKRDNTKVTALAAKVAGLEKQLSDIHIKQAMAVADLLTPRQRETMRIGAGPNGPAPIRR